MPRLPFQARQGIFKRCRCVCLGRPGGREGTIDARGGREWSGFAWLLGGSGFREGRVDEGGGGIVWGEGIGVKIV